MKQYSQPETQVLQVMNTYNICAGSAPGPSMMTGGSLGTMTNTSHSW